jgi:hypothetical protein
MEYRIVRRNKIPHSGRTSSYDFYYAQMKIFGQWIDCRHNPFIDTYDSYDHILPTVEKWVNNQIKGELPIEEEVVKTYE